jgi:exopolysaccharide biosynthesis polyprenyl glycosylphosphotransferase
MTPQTATQPKPQGRGGIAQATLPTVALTEPATRHAIPATWPGVQRRPGQGRPRLARASTQRRLLASADAVAALLALVAVLTVFGDGRLSPALLAWLPLTVALFKVAGLYDRDDMRLRHSTLDETPLLLQLSGMMALLATIVAPLTSHGSLDGGRLAVLWLGLFVSVFLARTVARVATGRLLPAERCLVIGEVDRAEQIREKLEAAGLRASVVASLPLEGEHELTGEDAHEAIAHLVHQLRVDRLIIAPEANDGLAITEAIRVARSLGVRVSVQPRMLEVVGSSAEFDDVEGMTLLGVKQFGLPRSSRFVKRAFDLVATGIGMLAVAPIMAVIAVAIRLDTNGSVFYRQVRVGRDGRHFSILKFRSMVENAHAQRETLRSLNVAGEGLFKIVDDPRVTRVGALLRRTSLDELPQLLNVLRGEMSLVGPRPLVLDEDAQVVGLDRQRLHLTPGMTGPWQVLGMRVPMAEMVNIDYLYVANWTLWLDLKVLCRTVRHVLKRGNV